MDIAIAENGWRMDNGSKNFGNSLQSHNARNHTEHNSSADRAYPALGSGWLASIAL